MKKRILSCMLAGTLVLTCVVACGKTDNEPSKDNDTQVKQEETVEDVKDAEETVVEDTATEESEEETEKEVAKVTAGKQVSTKAPAAKTDDVTVDTSSTITVVGSTSADHIQVGTEESESESEGTYTESAFAELFVSNKSLTATATKIFGKGIPSFVSEAREDGWKVATQGGYTDGTYHYQAFIVAPSNFTTDASVEVNNKVFIVKYDMSGNIVDQSEVLSLNHANDITYNSKLGYYVVCHAKPEYQISYLDPETLEIVDTFEIAYKVFSIDYNEASDRYIVGIKGGQTFRVLDGDFNPISPLYAPTSSTIGYTTQGVACDDDFVYFVLYKSNVITVYDWDGNFVTLIDTGIASNKEPENISVVDGKIYVGCGQSGVTLYELSFN